MLERGKTDPRLIARKLGYSGGALTAGIEKVKEIMVELGYAPAEPDPEIDNFLKKIKVK